ncbi:MAG TPA: beta-galactosidase [Tepidisphaeraceae bacterium]|nr:beta-galactosidase [Tepidisphaeraceae bacterium]
MRLRFVIILIALNVGRLCFAADEWTVGTPIVTYYAGPTMSDAVARQMAEGGFNVVWCSETQLDLLRRHGLRGMVHDGLLNPAVLDKEDQTQKLDDLIERVKRHPAFYSYYIIDEPSASTFPALAKLTAHLRQRDPAHMPYINLFPTYASNDQLGAKGDTVTAYREHLRQFVDIVKPMLLSWDNYQFFKGRDGDQYFLNLAMIRQKSLEANLPFLNIVQAASWEPNVRVPVPDEMRYLVYTTIAYGAQGISYYVYQAVNHKGGLATADGQPTPLYDAVKPLNREFVAIVSQLQPLKSTGVYHTSLKEPGCEAIPADAVFKVDPAASKLMPRGLLLGNFAKTDKPTHLVVVNLDYKTGVTATITGPGNLELFDPTSGKWSNTKSPRAELLLQPGGGQLIRVVE